MELWTALILGLVGSLHCAGMCGPLALALPVNGNSAGKFLLGRVAYNGGRILTYSTLGAVCGLIGLGFNLAGLQRWISLTTGVLVLVALAASRRTAFRSVPIQSVNWLKSALGGLLRRHSLGSLALLGMLNGLLPCGLVYAACAGAAASGGFRTGVEYMALFGFGTLPMMLGLSLAGRRLGTLLQFRYQKVLPVCHLAVGLLLVFRGLSLGIPWISPDLSAMASGGPLCH